MPLEGHSVPSTVQLSQQQFDMSADRHMPSYACAVQLTVTNLF